VSQEELQEVLSGLSDSDLRQMGQRLARSHEDLRNALADLQQEQVTLTKEKVEINSTITLMMAEMQKLNIRSDNLAEPQLEEGPVEFVGRMWEKLKPRDTALPISENVGELRRPSLSEEPSPMQAATERLKEQVSDQILSISTAIEQARAGVIPTPQGGVSPQELHAQLQERGQELQKQLTDRFSMMYSSLNEPNSGGYAEAGDATTPSVSKQLGSAWESWEALWKPPQEEAEKQPPTVGSLMSYLRTPSQQQELGADSAGPGDDVPPPREHPMQREEHGGSSSSSTAAPSTGPVANGHGMANGMANGGGGIANGAAMANGHAAANGHGMGPLEADEAQDIQMLVESAMAVSTPAPEAPSPSPAPAEAVVPPQPTPAPAPVKKPKDNTSTLVLQVQLTLGDGSVETVEMRATDRCKEVAADFIQEHALKDVFEAPLAAFLSESEKNAETFPCKLEADLDTIRREFNSKTA